jgi:hypothetical protein
MPPIRAASARLIPSRTAASDNKRRLWLAFFVAAARRRSSPAVKSVLIFTAAGMARILPAPPNQLRAQHESPHESVRKAFGIIPHRIPREPCLEPLFGPEPHAKEVEDHP